MLRPKAFLAALLVIHVLALAGCGLPVTTFEAYRAKAVEAAEETISQAETTILTVDLVERDRLFGTAATIQLEDAERAAIDTADGFASVLPPDDRSERLRTAVVRDVERASDLVARIRFALRRDDLVEARRLRTSLEEVLARLERFVERFA